MAHQLLAGRVAARRSWTASTARCPSTREDNWVWSPQGVVDMHRPERWGYVQFSTAPPGTVSYKPDPAGPIRRIRGFSGSHKITLDVIELLADPWFVYWSG